MQEPPLAERAIVTAPRRGAGADVGDREIVLDASLERAISELQNWPLDRLAGLRIALPDRTTAPLLYDGDRLLDLLGTMRRKQPRKPIC